MRQISDKDFAKLASLLVGLQDLLDRLESQGAKLTPAQQARIDEYRSKSRCLICDLPLDGEVRRGCHQSCYNAMRTSIRRGEITTQQAIDKGWLNPIDERPGPKGRPNPIRSHAMASKAIAAAKNPKGKIGNKAGTRKT